VATRGFTPPEATEAKYIAMLDGLGCDRGVLVQVSVHGTDNSLMIEVLLPDGAQKYGLEQDIVVGRDGMVHVPHGPGLGAAIDFKLIERKKVAVLS